MRLDILTNDGSPLGVTSKTIWGDHNRIGVGGAELALLTMCEEWTKAGHEVILYNDPWEANASPFQQLPISAFNSKGDRDALIIFRSPNLRSIPVDNCLKVWWSCDQQTVGDFKSFSETVDKIVCISPFHQEYFASTYGITNTMFIDLPVRLGDFESLKEEKVRNRVIFTSVPARGLMNLARMWPRIKKSVPDASLVITSDYRLWGVQQASNETFKLKFLMMDGVEYLGAVPRIKLIEELLKAELFLYPSNYDELFCIACSEAQCAGAYPITSTKGALPTTNMGTLYAVNAEDVRNDTTFVEGAVEFLNNPDKDKLKWDIQELAVTRFSPERILGEWNEKVFNS